MRQYSTVALVLFNTNMADKHDVVSTFFEGLNTSKLDDELCSMLHQQVSMRPNASCVAFTHCEWYTLGALVLTCTDPHD